MYTEMWAMNIHWLLLLEHMLWDFVCFSSIFHVWIELFFVRESQTLLSFLKLIEKSLRKSEKKHLSKYFCTKIEDEKTGTCLLFQMNFDEQ